MPMVMPSKIRILFLGANPSDTTRLALSHEVREITQRLRATDRGARFELVQEWAVRVDDLQAALLRHEPQIVHFSGHGRGKQLNSSLKFADVTREMLPKDEPDEDELNGAILVEGDSGRAKPIPTSALANLFSIVGGVRCVVLNACHSATQAETIRQHVDVVVGMSRSIQDAAAINFAWAFYQGLGFGKSLSEAFELGKNQIELAGFGDGKVPRLLTRESQRDVPVFADSITAPPAKNKTGSKRQKPARVEKGRVDPFLARVERVAKQCRPGAQITRHDAPPPFAGALEVEVNAGGFLRVDLVGAVDAPITEELAARFANEIYRPFRRRHAQLRSTLVHRGNATPTALREEFDRQGIEIQTFDSFQGLFDMGTYLEWQSRELEKNPAYPPGVYVDPPAWIKIAGNRELQHTENALQTMWDLLATPGQRRFLLVLGEFGAGKTFLLRELCRQMVQGEHPVFPVLLDMSKLEKQHDLVDLVGAHFGRANVPRYTFKAFQHMLEDGRIALFFDGFDELADKVTYDSATAHLDTVLAAAKGQAKVVLSSRRQHFLTEGEIHKAVEREFARKAESAVQGGYRLVMLEPFGEPHIRRYLRNVLATAEVAEARYRLIDEVKDLVGLAHNPRMLSFIADIPETSLREAKERWGEINSAKLYELLVNQWLDFEHERSRRQGWSKGISREALLLGMVSLAQLMWHARATTVLVNAIRQGLGQALKWLGEPALDAAVVTHLFGSGSLLVRDEEGQFSFVHRSVMEWLVAKRSADELLQGQDPPALVVEEMSALMADFFAAMGGRERVATWAREKMAGAEDVIVQKNSALLLKRMGERFDRVNFEGQDLRGKDFSGVDWRGANLRGADLREATLRGADLRGALLAGAKFSHADLRNANLARADLAGTEFSFVRAVGADFSMAGPIDPERFRGANLLFAKNIPDELHEALLAAGAAPPVLPRVEPICYQTRSTCNGIAWSPDGALLAAAYADGAIWLMDVVACKVLRVFSGHGDSALSVTFAPDGKTLASSSACKVIRFWDVATGRALRTLEGHADAVRSIAFAPDGKILASGSGDKTIRLWDVTTGQVLRILEGHADAVKSVAFSPNGQVLATASGDKTIRLWDVATGGAVRTLEGKTATVNFVAFSPDGQTLAAASGDVVRLWDVATGDALRTLQGPSARPYGKKLASATGDAFQLWHVALSRAARALGLASPGVCVAFSPDGKLLGVGLAGGTVNVIADGHLWCVFGAPNELMTKGVLSADGQTLASCFGGYEDKSSNRTIPAVTTVWEVNTARKTATMEQLHGVALSPDGRLLAAGDKIWDVAAGRPLDQCTMTGNAATVAFSPDGKWFVSALQAKTGTGVIQRVGEGRSRIPFEHDVVAMDSAAIAPDGQLAAFGGRDTAIRLCDVSTGKTLRHFAGHKSRVTCIAFSPNGKALASGSEDKTLRLWDLATGQALRVFEGHGSTLNSIAFSPDGGMLAAGLYRGTVWLWDVATGRALHVFGGHGGAVSSVAFSRDGKTLAVGSSGQTLRLWDIATRQCRAIFLVTPAGWVAFTPDGRYKLDGDIAGSFWHVVGLCRFDPGELDEYLNLRIADDAPLLT
jgi:WD40 repeat protein